MWDDGVDDGETGSVDRTVVLAGRTPRPRREGMREQGQHADYDGEGNRSSIGIEMCENAGNSREVTLDRTAKFTALLMKQYGIPISKIVPHQHWRMIRYDDKRDLGHKTCPHFLVKGGESDPNWQAFLARVSRYRSQL